jgi:hypothetical protein
MPHLRRSARNVSERHRQKEELPDDGVDMKMVEHVVGHGDCP